MRERTLGILGLVSLIIPWFCEFNQEFQYFVWLLFSYFSFRGQTFFLTLVQWVQWSMIYAVFSLLTFILVLVGSILLVTKYSLKVGSSLILLGVVVTFFHWIYNALIFGIRIFFPMPIPIGLLLAFLVGVGGLFFSVKTAQPATLPPPPPPPPLPPPPPQPVLAKLICKYCGAENPLDSVYCKNCGSKIGGGGGPESAGTQVKPTDVDRELALLEEWLSKLEELYRKGEVEEDAYKRLKEEYEIRKRELEETRLP